MRLDHLLSMENVETDSSSCVSELQEQKTGRVPKVRVLPDCESRRARRESAAEGSLFNLEGAGDEVCGKRR